jgi:hypothetical protein
MWDEVVERVLSQLNIAVRTDDARRISLDCHPFLPMYRELPTTSCGYVYMIVSLTSAHAHFIGEADNIKQALREHNTGQLSTHTVFTALQTNLK